MICPVCRNDTIIVEYKDIELDYCPGCHGVWFDSGELGLLLEEAGLRSGSSFLENIMHTPEVKVSEKDHRCPVCMSKMKKVHIDEEKKIITDVCAGGHGIWFDGGEVAGLVKTLAAKSPQNEETRDVLGFIADLFKHQAENIW